MDQSDNPNDELTDDLSATELSVGEILRRGRKHYGQSLEQVSSALRIRAKQLEALEKGEWHRLPGQVYTIGFVRAYAEYLGLDGEKMVRLLKMQSDGFTRLRPKLSFPAPPSENRAPGWKSLVLAFIFAIGAIYLWETTLSKDPVSELDTVAKEEIKREPVSLSESVEDQDGLSIENIPIISPNIPEDRILEEFNKNNEIVQRTLESSTLSTEGDAKDEMAIKPVKNRESDILKSGGQVVDNVESESSEASKSEDSETETRLKEAVDNMARPDQVEKRQEMPPDFEAPDGRIVLKSVQSSWIEIKDKNGKQVFARVLRPGDKYIVPDDQDILNLTTGNAGGLVAIVNGREIGRLGERGDIIRGIELSPQSLGKIAQQ